MLASSAEAVHPRRTGVVLWALLTLLIACAVTGYLLRDKLKPILAGFGLVSAPGAVTPATPASGTRAAPSPAVPAADGGSDATPSNAPGDAAAGSARNNARPGQLGACVVSYFEKGTFHSTEGFEFLCKDNDFRGVTSLLYRRIVAAGGGKVTPGMKEWSGLHWYELPATAVIRHACCPADTKPIQLPKEGGDKCDQLSDTLDKMAATPPAPADVSSRTDLFAKTVECMFAKGVPRPFHYGKLPNSANRAAFEAFWRRAATQ